jgi:hypothetical protein
MLLKRSQLQLKTAKGNKNTMKKMIHQRKRRSVQEAIKIIQLGKRKIMLHQIRKYLLLQVDIIL